MQAFDEIFHVAAVKTMLYLLFGSLRPDNHKVILILSETLIVLVLLCSWVRRLTLRFYNGVGSPDGAKVVVSCEVIHLKFIFFLRFFFFILIIFLLRFLSQLLVDHKFSKLLRFVPVLWRQFVWILFLHSVKSGLFAYGVWSISKLVWNASSWCCSHGYSSCEGCCCLSCVAKGARYRPDTRRFYFWVAPLKAAEDAPTNADHRLLTIDWGPILSKSSLKYVWSFTRFQTAQNSWVHYFDLNLFPLALRSRGGDLHLIAWNCGYDSTLNLVLVLRRIRVAFLLVLAHGALWKYSLPTLIITCENFSFIFIFNLN